jgi:hypothetical protein
VATTAELAKVHRKFGQVSALLLRYPNVISVGVGLRRRRGRNTREACFVVGVSRKLARPSESLPSELLGVRVDVQVVRPIKLLSSIAGAGDCRAAGRKERGQLAMLATRAGELCALTALHVLVAERARVDVRNSGLEGLRVEGRCLVEPFMPVGRLVAGAFNHREDIALVQLDASVPTNDRLVGTPFRLRAPGAMSTSLIASKVRVSIASEPSINGFIDEWPVSALFATEAGPLPFEGLAKFRLKTARVKGGWSGAAIFTPELAPIALLSFGSNPGRDGRVPAYAYGFPLAPHWQAWGLSTVHGG